jgi:hypothetical protein
MPSEALEMSGRDKGATWSGWRSIGALCRELEWSKPRLLYELRNGLPYRTFPPGYVIDWHKLDVERSLDLEASTVTPVLGVFGGGGIGFDRPTLGVDVLPPADAAGPEPLSPPLASPASEAASAKKVSEAALRQCLQDIVDDHAKHRPDSPPPDEEALHTELEQRLGATLERDRVRNVRNEVAPDFKLRVGRPRKTAQ